MSLDKKKKIGIISLIIVISGLFGWIYEFIFYYFNGGMKIWYMQGGNFLPWINIYAIGALFILKLTYRYKNKPLIVFLLSIIITGIIEYISGLLIFEILHKRYWDYNVEILNFGNINGFICLRSVLFFGVSGLILVYLITPLCIKLSKRKYFFQISIILLSLVLIDELYNLVITNIFNLPNAIEVYKSLGFKYVN